MQEIDTTEIDEQRIRNYISRCDEPTVAQILGRFQLEPDEHYETIAAFLEHYNRARAQQGVPSKLTEPSWASYGRSGGQEEENHQKKAGLPGLPGLPGHFSPPSPEIEGGEGGRARVDLSDPRKLGTNGSLAGGEE